MLELTSVSKKYGGRAVVDGLSFCVEPGQVLGLLGANGAGKSTCIGMIATLIKPDKGEILFNGENIVKNPKAIRKKLGYVPQDIALYESLNGLDNLKFWGKSYGVESGKLKEEISRVCNIISFDEALLKKRVSEYSGGMKRRLNIGVALLHNPELVVLDEPTTGIDLQSGEQILKAIRELSSAGTAIIYVGHYMEEVESICTHLCILDKGKSKAYGTAEGLLKETGCSTLKDLYSSLLGKQ